MFLNYDKAALDYEYDNRAKVANFAHYVKRWPELSQQARNELSCQLNIAYGDHPEETLDIFPAADANAPIHVYYHGGYWRALHKDDFSYVTYGLQAAGATVVIVNYTLIPHVDMSGLVQQCITALAWVWRNADSFGGDRDRIYISGHSAGGHLTTRMMAVDWPSFADDLPADLIKGGCAISGLHDLEPIRLCFLNEELHLSEQDVAEHSPMQLTRHSAGSLLLPVGDLEGPEYLRQSQQMAEAWQTSGSAPEVMVMAGHDHFSIADQMFDPNSELSIAIQTQMQLKQ